MGLVAVALDNGVGQFAGHTTLRPYGGILIYHGVHFDLRVSHNRDRAAQTRTLHDFNAFADEYRAMLDVKRCALYLATLLYKQLRTVTYDNIGVTDRCTGRAISQYAEVVAYLIAIEFEYVNDCRYRLHIYRRSLLRAFPESVKRATERYDRVIPGISQSLSLLKHRNHRYQTRIRQHIAGDKQICSVIGIYYAEFHCEIILREPAV